MRKQDLKILAHLNATLRDWAAAQSWASLRPIQTKVIEEFAGSPDHDLLVTAPTATGKTEAVFLPLLSELMGEALPHGFEVLYICPLKTLINQQHDRLAGMIGASNRKVTAWHGEVSQSTKQRARRLPNGVLITTPESLEAMFIRPGDDLRNLLSPLRAIVIDEIHSFFGTARGMQLLSIMSRIEGQLGRRIRRIGISATLDPDIFPQVRRFLRADDADGVIIAADDTSLTPVNYHVEAFYQPEARVLPDGEREPTALEQIAKAAADDFLGHGKSLIFANSRGLVEFVATNLKEAAVHDPTRGEVFPHHGSLERKLRTKAEAALRDETHDKVVVVCSPTLELGIDIGAIEQVGQIDAGPSVASLRQRLGRSGRKSGKVSALRMYIRETAPGTDLHPIERLHLPTFQAVAQVALTSERRFEPPAENLPNLSTLIQQSLSTIIGSAEITVSALIEQLITRGAFKHVDPKLLVAVLESLESEELVTLTHRGRDTLVQLGRTIERLRKGPQLYAAFQSGPTYVVRAGPSQLGTIPAGHGIQAGERILFAGRQWIVQKVLSSPPTIIVAQSTGGNAPRFAGPPIPPSQQIVARMEQLYRDREGLPTGINVRLGARAKACLEEGRTAFHEFDLARRAILDRGEGAILFPWTGPTAQTTLIAALRFLGLSASSIGTAITVDKAANLARYLEQIASWDSAKPTLPNVSELARNVKDTRIEKFDYLLSPYLRRVSYASLMFDAPGAARAAQRLLVNS
ncbi:DEAD/DEAH box helicase [Mesorhizobium sp. CU2]|uniref:DEAD/DEAH box helicase n=1 Tax=unclassified Mesorhizobium TaxID=325217 RepID=UPI001129043F|nr:MULTISPECIES: DEAD/DEAH box helicase [unclassified Mesorhizobium]TPN82580.1 DEAD/DEAH box helicase [Mesorhizobium sp. CU3]TPO12784.1 DEAD/DEAH box helicase [Mesorhizobium sp. CU2]